MKILAKTKNLNTDEWRRLRLQGIGGSDVSIIAGINKFRSAHQLWLEKTGQIEPEETESEYAHFGTILEPIVKKEFTRRTGLKIRSKNMLLQSDEPDLQFMIANVDGVIKENEELVIFEAKTVSAYKKEEVEYAPLPEHILQVQHYMKVIGTARKAYIAYLCGGNQFFYHVVYRDDELIEKMIEMERYFWEEYVMKGVEPIPDGSDATTRYFNSKFYESNGKTIELPGEVIPICDKYEIVSNELKILETEKAALANQIKNYMKEYETGIVQDRKIVWKTVEKSSFDSKRLKKEKPDLYEDYLTHTQYRRLQVA